ncbi:DMT family transporter [Neisseria sp. Ec49-e6-T10]|uniref:DMT family transporter n=1 Tax=Neisseria sp. Ec49-e6-T10 TaxID=3140744 RepID=UPI003EB728FB
MKTGFLWLFVAIVAEVLSTHFLKATEGFSKLVPTVLVLLGYAIAFFCLSQTIKTIPTGIAYAIWCGMGIVLVNLLAFFLYGQKLDVAAVAGITLISVGVLVIQVFSKTTVG